MARGQHSGTNVASRRSYETQSLTPAQKQVYEGAMAKKIANDAASKTRKECKGKYFRRAQDNLNARRKAFQSMPADVQRSQREPGSMKTNI